MPKLDGRQRRIWEETSGCGADTHSLNVPRRVESSELDQYSRPQAHGILGVRVQRLAFTQWAEWSKNFARLLDAEMTTVAGIHDIAS